ncbi:1-aminocyclopropane-1-carboxylate deaminase/D-cysteine desulfhydrase [Marinomonas sp. 2405UD68-3]|uniref:1-aminocyclopropane-1-carboxylate deaminase/D-cysteine desulfhydrase n=1 Tax=Marinomonas sp. 2405UD68-3 TaxID=3391835 RepID=UPI0039C97538
MSLFQTIILPKALSDAGYQLTIYRGDLEHQGAPGNKWHKLKYNIEKAQSLNAKCIASFGGPFSNHLHALGNICSAYDMQAVAVVRGELQPSLTPTLKDFVSQGGLLWPSSRSDYRKEMESNVRQDIDCFIDGCYWIPEGGSNSLGVQGCLNWSKTIYEEGGYAFPRWVISAGTGTTSAGFLANQSISHLCVIPAIKGGEGLEEGIVRDAKKVEQATESDRLTMKTHYHCGGYAKLPNTLRVFLDEFSLLNPSIQLDPVYTVKVLFGIVMEMSNSDWPLEKTLLIHTGGIQGWRGYI